jgi:predicted hydrocarbon binding protein
MTNRAPLLRISAATLPALHRAIASGREAADAARLARQFGFESGPAFYEALQAWSAEEAGTSLDALPPEQFWEMVATFFSSLGWGELTHERPHPGLVSLRSPDWAEAQPGSGARHPGCHVTTGVLADLLARVAGTDLAVMEVECRSRGDEHCRFLIGGVEALGTLYEELRQGHSLDDAIERL